MSSTHTKISFIGFGEAAKAFVSGLQGETVACEIKAYDIKTNGNAAQEKFAEYKEAGIVGAASSAEACDGADIIFSLVTASQAAAAAEVASKANLKNAYFLDCNSCAPDTKRRSAKLIEAAGGHYIDAAIMTPVHPRLHRSPSLLSGPNAKKALELTRSLGMETALVGETVGAASVRKMVRSAMVKGLEALTLECFLAGRKAGIEQEVLSSLEASYPGFDWQQRVPYMMERATTHGIRRAEEMREVCQTLSDLGINPHVSRGTVEWQQDVGALGLDAKKIGQDDIAAMSDAILASLAQK